MTYFNYFTEIEETFVRRRKKHLMISPMDWALIDAWKDRGVPLHIVIRAINDVFNIYDKQPAGTRPIGSLSYCKNEVEAQYAEYLASQVGRSSDAGDAKQLEPAFTIERVEQHIDSAIDSLRNVGREEISGEIDRAISRLMEIRSTLTEDYEAVDAALNDIEKDLEAAMLTSWTRPEIDQIEKEVAGPLAGYRADMEPADYDRTYTLMLLKKLREVSGIPRLGLFYL